MRVLRIAALLVLLLAACSPVSQESYFPKARLVGAELVSLDPFADRLTLKLDLEVKNPNSFDLPILASKLQVKLGELTTGGRLPQMTIPKNQSRRVTMTVDTGIGSAARTVARLVSGEELPLVITGSIQVGQGSFKTWLGPATLLSDRVKLDLSWRPPEVELLGARANLGFGKLEIAIRYRVKNPMPVGFVWQGKLSAQVGSARVGDLPVDLRLPPAGTSEGELKFSLSLADLPGVASALASGLPFELVGDLKAKIPGVWENTLPFDLVGLIQ